MGSVIIQKYTTKFPLQMIGEEAGICWGALTGISEKDIKRAWDCIESGHGRTIEFPDVYMVIDGYSARVIRELYTHIGGAPTRLQASTRYIDYAGRGFEYITPPSIANNEEAKDKWNHLMVEINDTLNELETIYNIPREDAANGLPLGMITKIVLKINLRTLVAMANMRLCSRAYWEFRQLMQDIMKALSAYSEEWAAIVKALFVPKCEVAGYCTETRRGKCKRKPKKEEFFEIYEQGLQILKYADNPTLEYGA